MLRTRRTDLPKEGRIGDTIQFIRNAVVVGGQDWGNPIADLLQEIPISAAVDQAMSQGTTGTELTRKYRRALTLILCALNNVPPARAQQMVAQYSYQNLPTALGTMFSDVQRVCMPQRLNPPLQQLLAAPAVFLAANRIKTGRGSLTTSTPTCCGGYFDRRWLPVERTADPSASLGVTKERAKLSSTWMWWKELQIPRLRSG
jgi:hypothetical protein